MTARVKDILYSSSVLIILAACLLTGREQSLIRLLFFPLVILLALRTTSSALLTAGTTFTVLFAVMAFYRGTPGRGLPLLSAEIISFFLATVAASIIPRRIDAERGRGDNSATTLHHVSKELEDRSRELNAALDALSKAHRQLQETERARGRFIANLSHELRAPLVSIRAYSGKLLEYVDIDDAAVRESIRNLYGEGEHLTRLIEKNIDMLRMGAGKPEMRVTPVDPQCLIDVGMKVVAPLAEKKGIPLTADIPAGFPPVKGDQVLLTQALVTLLSNAVACAEAGDINVGVRRKDGMAEFSVSFTGGGDFPKGKELLLDELSGVAGPRKEGEIDSGAGIAEAREIIEKHCGGLRGEGLPGKGGAFFFTVPFLTEEKTDIPPEPHPCAEGASGLCAPILVQSESIVIRQSLRKLLESMGYRTIGADTPERGMKVTVKNMPGLIISDNLEGSGEFICLANWAREAGVIILLVNLYVDSSSGNLGVVANGYFNKPFDKFQIISTIEHFVRDGGRLFIVSPLADESGKLSMILNAEGYSAELYRDGSEALKGLTGKHPEGVIIGSFPRAAMEDVITELMNEPRFNTLPFFLMRCEGCARFVAAVTLDSVGRRNDGRGLSPLIAMIEKHCAEKG